MNNTPWPGHGWHKFNSVLLSMVGRLRCVPVLLYYFIIRIRGSSRTRWLGDTWCCLRLTIFCSRLYYVDQVPVIKQFVRSPSLSPLPFFCNVFASSADDVDSFCRTHTCIICLYLIDDDHNKMCLSVDGERGDCRGRDRERGRERATNHRIDQLIAEIINGSLFRLWPSYSGNDCSGGRHHLESGMASECCVCG